MNSHCWSELPSDLLASIAKRIQFIEDFVAFRGVCVSWRAAATKDCFNRSLPKIPILMLAEKDDTDDREFFCLSRGKMCFKMALPEAKGKRCFESKGWFLTVGCKGEIHLLHPFSRVQIELPNVSRIMNYDAEIFDEEPRDLIHLVELSCSPFESSDFVVMIAGYTLGVDFWRPGNNAWTRIDLGFTCLFSDLTFFNGKVYVVNYMGEIWICDISSSLGRKIVKIDNKELYLYKKAYLVESSGELLVVFRNGHCLRGDDDYGATHFNVVQVDLNKSQGGWTIMKSLGDKSLFVGHSSSFSIHAICFEDSMIKPNCIYFTDDSFEAYYHTSRGGGKDMGIFHFEDEDIERLPNFESFSKISPPVFITPYF